MDALDDVWKKSLFSSCRYVSVYEKLTACFGQTSFAAFEISAKFGIDMMD